MKLIVRTTVTAALLTGLLSLPSMAAGKMMHHKTHSTTMHHKRHRTMHHKRTHRMMHHRGVAGKMNPMH